MSNFGVPNAGDFLHKLAMQRGIPPPTFRQLVEQGPSHMRTFVWECTFHNMTAQGQGRSKKDAKNAAAKAIKIRLDPATLPDGPGYQEYMEKKRKREEEKARRKAETQADGPPGEGDDGEGFAALEASQAKKKYDYQKHVQRQQQQMQEQALMFQQYRNASMHSGFSGDSWFGAPDPDYVGHQMGLPPTFTPGPFGPGPGFGGFGGGFGPGPRMPMNHPMMGGPMGGPMMRPGFGPRRGGFGPFGPMMGGGPGRPQFRGGPGPMQQPKFGIVDEHILTKHRAISPKDEHIEQLLRIVSDAEEALQKAAEKGEEPLCRLQGVSRVGDVAKGLLLAPDRAVNLVLGCSEPPTAKLLKAVREVLVEQFKTVAEDREYQLHEFEEEAGFCVVYMPKPKPKEEEKGASGNGKDDSQNEESEEQEGEVLPYAVNITLTCARLRDAKPDEELDGLIDDDDRHLPLDKCQQALAEMRRSKWFVSNASNLPSCVETIRIVKELSQRVSAWRCLSDWCIELLCESVLRSSPMPITMPGRAVRRVMEAVASGLLLPDGRGIRDPCERGDVDAAAALTDQQREDLTSCAQTYLRYMQFNKVHLVLGMDKLVMPNRNKGQQQKGEGEDEGMETAEGDKEGGQGKAEAES